MKEIKQKSIRCNKTIIGIIVIFFYILINLVLLYNHEAWRDEAQAWILVKNSSFFEVFSYLNNEGHPCLWFIILFIITRLGLSYSFMGISSIAIMTIAMILFWYKSPFHVYIKILLVFSPVFFYFNPIICRIYCVNILVILLLCIIWKNREEHIIIYAVLIAIIFQTHILLSGFAIGCMIDIVIITIRRKRSYYTSLIPIISLIALVAELKQGKEKVFVNVNFKYISNMMNPYSIRIGIESVFNKYDYGIYKVCYVLIILSLFIVITTVIAFYIYSKNKVYCGELLAALIGICSYFFIIVFIRRASHIQISITFLSMLLFVFWTQYETIIKKRIVNGIIIIIILLIIPKSILSARDDILGDFSGSKEFVNEMNKLVTDETKILVINDYRIPPVYAYASENNNYYFWDISNGEEYKKNVWGKKDLRTITENNIFEYIDCEINDEKEVYIVLPIDFELDNTKIDAQLLYKNKKRAICSNEAYKLYKITYN